MIGRRYLLRAHFSQKVVRYFSLSPREHQLEAVHAVENAFTSGATRATIVMPGGAGKSLVAAEIIQRTLKEKQIALLVTPTLALVDQVLNDLYLKEPYIKMMDILVVASKTCAPSEKIQLRSTNTNEIASKLQLLCTDEMNKKSILCISTYASLIRINNAMQECNLFFDIAIFDEAHITTYASKNQRQNVYSLPLDNSLQTIRRVFMTATPRTRREADKRGSSMDNIQKYGNIVYQLSSQESVARGVTVPLTVLVVDATKAYENFHKKRCIQFPQQQQQKDMDRALRDFELAYTLIQVHLDHGPTRFFVFHTTNERAEQFVQRAQDLWNEYVSKEYTSKNFVIDRVHGNMNPQQREKKLELIRHSSSKETNNTEKDSIRILTNVNILAQGVDVPLVDAVVLADPRRSQVYIAQIAARAARAAPEKTRGIILLPIRKRRSGSYVFEEDTEQLNQQVEPRFSMSKDDFSIILDVLQATVDERISKKWRALVARVISNTSMNNENFLIEYNRVLKLQNNETNSPLLLDMDDELAQKFNQGLRTAALNLSQIDWELCYIKLEEYYTMHGHTDVPLDYIDENDNIKLGLWVQRQRLAYRNGTLTEEKYQLLQSIAFRWHHRKETSWYQQFNEWLKTRHDQSKPSGELKIWIRTNRYRYWRKLIAKKKVDLLQQNGFDWGSEPKKKNKSRSDPPLKEIFDDALKAYLNYREIYGEPKWTCKAPIFYQRPGIDSEPKQHYSTLGIWINMIKSNEIKLTEQQNHRLKAVAFPFSLRRVRKRRTFEQDIQDLIQFKQKFGHTAVPDDYDNSSAFTNRINAIRWGRISLTAEQRQALNDIGFAWTAEERKKQRDEVAAALRRKEAADYIED